MVDFSTLGSSTSSATEYDPRKIFNGLVKPEGVNELYASQSDVLEKWFQNRSQSDHVLKLPTGGGKSLVGLLISQSTLNELRLPVAYAVPTRQLVRQVCDEASRFGIKAVEYVSAKEGIPADFLNGRAIGVVTYEAVFNGRSKFGTSNKSSELEGLGAIILDDAHAAFETVWDNFSFKISASDHKDLYLSLVGRFREAFERIGRVVTFDEVVQGKEPNILEVPYWDWFAKLQEVAIAIQSYDPDKIDGFSWRHVKDDLATCHVLVSRTGISLVPLLPFTDKSLAFSRAKRRIYMSATISDDGEIVRTFGAPLNCVSNPIVAPSLAGVGERLILVPSMMQFPASTSQLALIKSLISSVKSADKNSLILTPSYKASSAWADVAQASTNTGESEALIAKLKQIKGIAVSIPRRYDGVDLPGEDCRLLILDGLPYGSSDYDLWRIGALSQHSGNAVLAQRVEQAIGRASRGTADYAVVVLTGGDLVTWLGKSSNQAFLSSSTKKQLDIGLTVSKAVQTPADFQNTAWQCLNREPGWRSYHATEMAAAATPSPPDLAALQVWSAERAGIESLRVRSFTLALAAFDQAIDNSADPQTKGWFHQLKARTVYQSGDHTQAEAWQGKAYRLNLRLTPPQGEVTVVKMERSQQAMAVCARLAQYTHPAVALSVFEESAAFLTPYGTANQFEGALEDLFSWLGFSASRPDRLYKIGPDVLALGESGPALIIEAKSRMKAKNKLTKTLHNQALSHENWFVTHYGQEPRSRIVVASSDQAEDNAGTHGTFVLTFDILATLVTDARNLLKACSEVASGQCGMLATSKISELGLTAQAIVARLKPFSDAAP